MAGVVDRNIRALLHRQRVDQTRVPLQVRIADRITQFTGSMRFIYVHLVLFGVWIIWNLPWIAVPKFDRSFVILAMVASVEAIFLSTFVLITQNRMSERAARRADLDLQISLLAEHEVTQLISMVKEIAENMGVELSDYKELSELQKDVAPEQVLDLLEQRENEPQPSEPPRG